MDNRYRVPDKRYKSGYRLTPEGMRLRRTWNLMIWMWIALLIVGPVAHAAFLPITWTLVLIWYGVHRYRVRHRQLPPPPPLVYLPPPPPAYVPPAIPEPLGRKQSRHIPQPVKIAVSTRDNGRCRSCGAWEDLHFDHVIPWSKGGAATVDNIQLLCGKCNLTKSDRSV